MTMQEFEELVEKTIAALPEGFKKKIENLAVVVEDYPSDEILLQLRLKSKKSLLGLYQGVPITKRNSNYCNVLPDKITIFKKPIELLNQKEEDIKNTIRQVVIHEIGNYFGMNEKDLEQIEKE